MADDAQKPLVFISYSHKDKVYKDQVLTHLRGLSLLSQLEPWHDGDIGAGEHWYEEIEEKLNGCAVAVLLISANFLSSNFCMQTELPILLERRRRQKMMIMPILVESCFWQATPWLNAIQMRPGRGDVIEALTKPKRNAAYTKIIEEIHRFLESDDAREAVVPSAEQAATISGDNNQVIQIQGSYNTIIFGSEPKADTAYPKPLAIDLTRLPTSGFDVVGRDKELQLLNEAFDGDTLNVISLRAWGGVGKSTLVNKWCEYLAADNYRDARRVFAWSFYSQGTNERVTSADAFIDEALRFFGDEDPTAGSPWAKGERLAGLVGKEKALLILDGMEPLQDEHQGVKDPALARLVECLAEENAGLCVITTREPVKEFADFPDTTEEVDLEQLSKEAGRALLRIKGLRATDDQLEQASEAFGNHALALNLLASYLKRFAGGDVGQALTIPDLLDVSVDAGKHPRRVMAAFAEKFGEGPELDLLHVIGLFDRPADAGCIAILREQPAIRCLTERLSALSEIGWRDLLKSLRSIGLLAKASHHTPDDLDAHPLVREHFEFQLKEKLPDAWREGHEKLYEHLTSEHSGKNNAQTPIESLIHAVRHGCSAGHHQTLLASVYRGKITEYIWRQKNLNSTYLSAELAAISNFFEYSWADPSSNLSSEDQCIVLNPAGFRLKMSGRFKEAIIAFAKELESELCREDWNWSSISSSNLSSCYLALGNIHESQKLAREALECARLSRDVYRILSGRLATATAFQAAGDTAATLDELKDDIESESRLLDLEGSSIGRRHYPILFFARRYCRIEVLIEIGSHSEASSLINQTKPFIKKDAEYFMENAMMNVLEARIAACGVVEADAIQICKNALDQAFNAGRIDITISILIYFFQFANKEWQFSKCEELPETINPNRGPLRHASPRMRCPSRIRPPGPCRRQA